MKIKKVYDGEVVVDNSDLNGEVQSHGAVVEYIHNGNDSGSMLDLLRLKETARNCQFGMNSGSTVNHQDPCEKDKYRSTCQPGQSSVRNLPRIQYQ